jgi:ATP synthase protein I
MPFHSPIPDSKTRPKLASGLGVLVEAEKLMQIAILLPSATFIGWLGGAWLDSLLHQHWIAIVGLLFGGVSGLVYVIRLAIAAEKKTRDEDESDDKAGKTGIQP